MKWLSKRVLALAAAVTLGLSAMAFTAGDAAEKCWTENTNYQPGDSTYDCLGGDCRAGWCCLICT